MSRIPNHLLPTDLKERKALEAITTQIADTNVLPISSVRGRSGGSPIPAPVAGNPAAIAAVADIDPGIPGRDIAVNPIRRR